MVKGEKEFVNLPILLDFLTASKQNQWPSRSAVKQQKASSSIWDGLNLGVRHF